MTNNDKLYCLNCKKIFIDTMRKYKWYKMQDKIKMNNAEVNKTVNDIIERNKERRIRKLNMTDKFLFINRSSIDRVN